MTLRGLAHLEEYLQKIRRERAIFGVLKLVPALGGSHVVLGEGEQAWAGDIKL